MNIKNIVENSKPKLIDVYHRYSVLIPIINISGKSHILYEVRAKKLKSQPGEICFPGGKMEMGESIIDAAKRETMEELNLKDDDIEIYGSGDYLVSPFNSVIYTVIGEIKKEFKNINYSTDEVDSIFTVPIDFFLNNNPDVYENKLKFDASVNFPYHLIPGGKNYNFKRGVDNTLFYKYNDKVIWGLTAKMTKNFIDKIRRKD